MADTISGDMKTYPAKEYRAVDMAEMTKSLTMFSGVMTGNVAVNGGVIQGCRLAIEQDHTDRLRMSPGRILISGRLAEFSPATGNYIYLTAPSSINEATTCVIVAVCDLSNAENPFYVAIVTGTGTLDTKAARTTDELFNRNNGLRYLRLGTVKVSASGIFSNLTTNNSSYPIKDNKQYVDAEVDAIKNNTTNGNVILKEWVDYFRMSRFKSSFFKTFRAEADGLTLQANTSKTFKFRKEYDSLTYINAQQLPGALNAWINLKTDGDIIGQAADRIPENPQMYTEHGVPVSIGNKYVHLGIVGVLITNASQNPAGVSNLVLQSYYVDNDGEGPHVCATIKNTGSSAAKFRLAITSLYALDV